MPPKPTRFICCCTRCMVYLWDFGVSFFSRGIVLIMKKQMEKNSHFGFSGVLSYRGLKNSQDMVLDSSYDYRTGYHTSTPK